MLVAEWFKSKSYRDDAVRVLAEMYPGETVEIRDTIDVANAGWECDSRCAHVVHNGVHDLVMVDGTMSGPVVEFLQKKLLDYPNLTRETSWLLFIFFASQGEFDTARQSQRDRDIAAIYSRVSSFRHMSDQGLHRLSEGVRDLLNRIAEDPTSFEMRRQPGESEDNFEKMLGMVGEVSADRS